MKNILLLLVIVMLSSCESRSSRAHRLQQATMVPTIIPQSSDYYLTTEIILGCVFVTKRKTGGLIHHPKCPNHKIRD